MSKYKLGDPDYVIPDHGEAALRCEIGRLNEEVIPALQERIKELEAGTEKILTASAKKELQALEAIKALMERIKELEECLRFVRNRGMNTSKIDKVLNAGQR